MGRFLVVLFGLAFACAGVVLLVWLLWWLWKHHEEEKEAPALEIEVKTPPPASEVEVEATQTAPALEKVKTAAAAPVPVTATGAEEETPAEPPAPDDLTRIEGIGPKISGVLQAASITTFAQLAGTEVSRLEQILEEADPRLRRLADPATWPEQAALAAGGQWDAMEALQKELKRGRR
jgi:predicted flap endonuclease-1-like 5' DNA nuclease